MLGRAKTVNISSYGKLFAEVILIKCEWLVLFYE